MDYVRSYYLCMLGTPKSATSEEGMGKPWDLPYLNILFGLLHTGVGNQPSRLR